MGVVKNYFVAGCDNLSIDFSQKLLYSGEIMKRNISNMDLANEALFKKRDGAKRLNTDIYWAALLYMGSDLSDILNAENLGRDVKKIIEEIRKKYIADYE